MDAFFKELITPGKTFTPIYHGFTDVLDLKEVAMISLIFSLPVDEEGHRKITVEFVQKKTYLKEASQLAALKELEKLGLIEKPFRKNNPSKRFVKLKDGYKEVLCRLHVNGQDILNTIICDTTSVSLVSQQTENTSTKQTENTSTKQTENTSTKQTENTSTKQTENTSTLLYNKTSIDKTNNKTINNEATASNFRLAPTQETTHVGSTLSEGANLKPPHDSNLEKDARAGVRARAQEAFEKFRVRYQGSKRGHDTELKTLMKHKDWMDVAMSLESALDVAIEQRAAKAAKKEFVPGWPNLQTYLNQRRWEESMQTVEDTSTGFNVSKYKNFQEAREAAQAEFLIDKDQEKRKRNMGIILNWKFPS